MTESAIEAKLVRGIKQLGGKAYKFVSPGNAGVPDRMVLLPGGQIIFVELKTERGRLSPIQKNTIGAMRELGADIDVLHGSAEVDSFLEWCKREVNR